MAEGLVAVVGGARLLGRAVAEQLEQRGTPRQLLRLSDRGDRVGQVQDLGGEAAVVAGLDPDLLGMADEVFLCVSEEEARPLLEVRRARGSLWVDLSGAAGARARTPLVNLHANPGALPRRTSGLVAAPGPEAQLLSTVLAPITAVARPRRANAVLLIPATEKGKRGLDELYRQAVSLLNFGSVPTEVFGTQLAFNVFPAPPAIAARAVAETVRVLGLGKACLDAAALQAPVFHGHGALVHLVFSGRVDPEALTAALEAGPGIELTREGPGPSPVDLAGSRNILAAPPRDDGTGRGVWLWAVGDDLVAGSAHNAVRIAGACREG